MNDEYHCSSCSRRSRANLTLYKGRLWSPECLHTVALAQIASAGRPVPDGTHGGVHGLRVVDRPRPLRRVK